VPVLRKSGLTATKAEPAGDQPKANYRSSCGLPPRNAALPPGGCFPKKSLDRSVNIFKSIGCNLSDLGLCIGRIAVVSNPFLPSQQHNNSLSISTLQAMVLRAVPLRRNRMNKCDQIEPSLQLKINDTLARSVRLRSHPGAPGDVDVVVEDPWLGAFALSNQFDLHVREEGSDWRPVALEELRAILAATTGVPDTETSNHQTPGPKPPDGPSEVAGARPKLVRLGTLAGLDACLQQIEEILYRASIPHLTAGSTFVVPSMMNARECLLRAGFHQDERYEAVLFDPEKRIAIRLLERDPRAVLG
jgi:hypothetical protein